MEAQSTQFQVMILAAGKGTRMKSDLPKVLHRVCGQTLLERSVRAAAGLKPSKIVVVLGYGEALVREELARLSSMEFASGIELIPVLQAEQNGTGHAAQVGLSALEEGVGEVMILSADSPLLSSTVLQPLKESYYSSDNCELAFLSTLVDAPHGFGRVIRDASGGVLKIVEEKDCSEQERACQEINVSIYLASSSFLSAALASLKSDNAQSEYYLTDIVGYGVSSEARLLALKSDESTALLGANTRKELSALEKIRREEINARHMEAGVTLEDPAATYIDEEVQIASDTFIGAGTRLLGQSKIAKGVVIEGNSLIRDSHIGEDSLIRLSCYLDNARVASRVAIGPFAHLRPGADLADDVKVGNFVEVKNCRMHEASKASHLTYLGDAEIGARANIGAGTITCNYDGKNKNKTSVGEDTFIGSNSCLIAPLEVGSNAYVAAGSTITRDVPNGSLGVARGKQRNVEDWVSRRKSKQQKE